MTFEKATKINKCKYFMPRIFCGEILNKKHCCGACLHHTEDGKGVYCGINKGKGVARK